MSNRLEGIAVLDFPKCKGRVIISETIEVTHYFLLFHFKV